ncbi:hypothetical protein QVD99_007962 [Batrachochytrium dendrobatidis]|nr:hypothetical protein O5D80_004883 [Batrachochytrium dendrobatidis]KAK5665107.1 hypothetical protein QVD99_007962 [Batrachochytrium dendrobatidis]
MTDCSSPTNQLSEDEDGNNLNEIANTYLPFVEFNAKKHLDHYADHRFPRGTYAWDYLGPPSGLVPSNIPKSTKNSFTDANELSSNNSLEGRFDTDDCGSSSNSSVTESESELDTSSSYKSKYRKTNTRHGKAATSSKEIIGTPTPSLPETEDSTVNSESLGYQTQEPEDLSDQSQNLNPLQQDTKLRKTQLHDQESEASIQSSRSAQSTLPFHTARAKLSHAERRKILMYLRSKQSKRLDKYRRDGVLKLEWVKRLKAWKCGRDTAWDIQNYRSAVVDVICTQRADTLRMSVANDNGSEAKQIHRRNPGFFSMGSWPVYYSQAFNPIYGYCSLKTTTSASEAYEASLSVPEGLEHMAPRPSFVKKDPKAKIWLKESFLEQYAIIAQAEERFRSQSEKSNGLGTSDESIHDEDLNSDNCPWRYGLTDDADRIVDDAIKHFYKILETMDYALTNLWTRNRKRHVRHDSILSMAYMIGMPENVISNARKRVERVVLFKRPHPIPETVGVRRTKRKDLPKTPKKKSRRSVVANDETGDN